MWAISSLTARRMRDPAMVILFIIGCVLAFGVNGLDNFELLSFNDNNNKLVGNNCIFFGTVILCGMGVLITVFNAASEIPRDISSRMISVLLSKPISRLEYVFGKFLGSLAVGGGCTFTWITILIACRAFLTEGGQSMTLGIIVSQYFCLLILLPITAIAICSSCCFSDVVSMILTTGYILFSFGVMIVPIIVSLSGAVFGRVVLLIYFLFPNMGFFLQSYSNVAGNLALLLYAASVSFIFLLIGTTRFSTGDIYSNG